MTSPARLERLRLAAQEAEQKQEWDDAFRLFDELASASGAAFVDRCGAIRAATFSGRLDEAAHRLERLEPEPGGDAVVAMIRAELAERRGSAEQAVECWRRAVDMQPESYWALFGLARSFKRVGRRDEARQVMAAALALPSAERNGVEFAAVLDLQNGRLAAAEALVSAFGFPEQEWVSTILGSLPGMTSQDERRALYDAARTLTWPGHLVDLGCWLGSLTVALAHGLKTNAQLAVGGIRVHAYDNFMWESPYMDAVWIANMRLPLPASGESFFPAFQDVTREWSELIEAHPEDLMTTQWRQEPIAILSVDAMKFVAVSRRIISEFYPSLQPGRSFLFHQDFCHSHTWWIHLHHFLLRDHFAVADTLPGSGGVLFRLVRPLEQGDLSRALDADLADSALADAAFTYSWALVAPPDRSTIVAARIRCELNNGRSERARDLLERYASDPDVVREFPQSLHVRS